MSHVFPLPRFVFEYCTQSAICHQRLGSNACLLGARKVEDEVSLNESLGLFMEESDVLILVSIEVAEPKCVTDVYFWGYRCPFTSF